MATGRIPQRLNLMKTFIIATILASLWLGRAGSARFDAIHIECRLRPAEGANEVWCYNLDKYTYERIGPGALMQREETY